MKLLTAVRALALIVLLSIAHNAHGAYKYQRLTETTFKNFEDGWQVIITNTGATMAAGPLENGALKGVPLTGFEGDTGTVASLGDATVFTMTKSSTQTTNEQYELSSNYGKLGYEPSKKLTFTASGLYNVWTTQVTTAGELIMRNLYYNYNVRFDSSTEQFDYKRETGDTNMCLYRVKEVDDPEDPDEPYDPHDPWAEGYLVTSLTDYSRADGVKLERDTKNPDVFIGYWNPFSTVEIETVGISFIAYDPKRDKEYKLGPAGGDVTLEKAPAATSIQLKGVKDSEYHWIVTPEFWDVSTQGLQVAMNTYTGDVAFGKDIITGVEVVDAVTDAPVRYFNLQGTPVSNPVKGVYIRVTGAKAEKVVIR